MPFGTVFVYYIMNFNFINMKKSFIFTSLVILLASCMPCQRDNTVVKKVETHKETKYSAAKSYDVYSVSARAGDVYVNERFAVIEIDSCEYVVSLGTGYRGYMAHKGNCKHCAKKRMEETRKILREECVSNKLW